VIIWLNCASPNYFLLTYLHTTWSLSMPDSCYHTVPRSLYCPLSGPPTIPQAAVATGNLAHLFILLLRHRFHAWPWPTVIARTRSEVSKICPVICVRHTAFKWDSRSERFKIKWNIIFSSCDAHHVVGVVIVGVARWSRNRIDLHFAPFSDLDLNLILKQ